MADENNISHEEFKVGISGGKIRFDIVNREKFSNLVHKSYFKILDWIFTILHIVFFVMIPLFSFLQHNWYLLFGFLGYFIGTIVHRMCISSQFSHKRIYRSIVVFCLGSLLTIIIVSSLGFFNIFSFIITCSFYEFLVSNIWVNLWVETGIKQLITNSDTYYFSIENNLIKVGYH
jgi:hypothetical protein